MAFLVVTTVSKSWVFFFTSYICFFRDCFARLASSAKRYPRRSWRHFLPSCFTDGLPAAALQSGVSPLCQGRNWLTACCPLPIVSVLLTAKWLSTRPIYWWTSYELLLQLIKMNAAFFSSLRSSFHQLTLLKMFQPGTVAFMSPLPFDWKDCETFRPTTRPNWIENKWKTAAVVLCISNEAHYLSRSRFENKFKSKIKDDSHLCSPFCWVKDSDDAHRRNRIQG